MMRGVGVVVGDHGSGSFWRRKRLREAVRVTSGIVAASERQLLSVLSYVLDGERCSYLRKRPY